MNVHSIQTIGIAGAGTMGSGIAQLMAAAGYKTILFDINVEMINKARTQIEKAWILLEEKGKLRAEAHQLAKELLVYTTRVDDLLCDLFIEAIVEKLEPKQELFRKIAALNSRNVILATNTSSIPVTQIAAGVPHPERVVGIHFFNPAPIMKLVEIISGAATHPDIAAACTRFIQQTGKTTVQVADAPGFIVNRVARHYYVEALKIAEEQVTDFATIDALMESCGFKMGPFKLMDLIGVDTNFSVTRSMYHLFHQDAKFRPSRLQQQKVDAGYHGRKTGKGFYTYE